MSEDLGNSKNPPWFEDVNSNPCWRTVAGLGTQVVQDQQEQLMASAWEQVEGVLEANRFKHLIQHSAVIAKLVYERHIQTHDTATLQQIVAPNLTGRFQSR